MRSQFSKFYAFALVSFVLHGVFFSSLFFKKSKKQDGPLSIPIALEFKKALPAGNIEGDFAGKHGGSSKKAGKRPTPNTQKSYFGSSFNDLAEKAAHGTAAGDTFLKDRKSDDPHAPWGQGSETFERIEDYLIFKVLFSRIDSSLGYPGVLSRHKVQGRINARFVLNPKGECDWHYTQILGSDPYLKLYVLDVLKRVCSENFKRYLKDRLITNVDIAFHFAISENGDEEYQKQKQVIVGNTLTFFRNSHQSVLEWELGPFRGMFPVPAVYLNIPWIQENWERLMQGKDPINEFKKEFG